MSNDKLYILMRDDMPSLTPGKAMAQAAHAASQFHEQQALQKNSSDKATKNVYSRFLKWKGKGTFGTTIVLRIDGKRLQRIYDEFEENATSSILFMDLVVDHSYPIQDGHITHHAEVTTCGCIFGPREDVEAVVGFLSLY